MGTLFLHQLHDHLKSLRFQIGLVILLLFFGASGAVYTWKMKGLVEEDARIDAENERRYQEVSTFPQAVGQQYRIVCRAPGTEFITEGGFNWFGDHVVIIPASGEIPPGPVNTVRSISHWMDPFELVDWSLIVRIVLSFLCVVLAYDAVSGEVESGTLRLVLANPLSRGRFLIAKFLAHLTVLLVAAILGSLLSLLSLSLSGALELDARILRGYGFFLLGTALYISLFLFLSMGISAQVRSSASSLVLLILAWGLLIVVIPQASYLVGAQVPGAGGWKWEAWSFMDEVRKGLEREGIGLRGRELGKGDNYAVEQRYARRLRESEKELERMAREARLQELRQYNLTKTINFLSPGFAFQYSIEAFLGTGVMRYDHFLDQAWQYRNTLRNFLRGRDAADPDSPHLLFFPDYMSDKPLDHRHIPRFEEVPLSLAEGVTRGVVPIVILVLEAAIAFFFALWAFNRAEIAG